jgi:hypothetical protein
MDGSPLNDWNQASVVPPGDLAGMLPILVHAANLAGLNSDAHIRKRNVKRADQMRFAPKLGW